LYGKKSAKAGELNAIAGTMPVIEKEFNQLKVAIIQNFYL